LNSIQSSARQGAGKFFLAEADESDGSFLKLNPTVAIVTNIDKDHLDYYKTFENIKSAFETFLSQVSFDGLICACLDDPYLKELLPKLKRQKISYGLSKEANITAKNIKTLGLKSSFVPVVFGKELNEVTLNLPGAYNIQNALASFGVADYLGIDKLDICQALSDFKGVEHRFTLVGEHKKVLVIDDYAHNPVKIKAVLQAAREHFKEKDIYAVFEPHRYSRVCNQFDDFAKSFSSVDKVIVTPIYGASEGSQETITHRDLEEAIKDSSFDGKDGHTFAVESLENVIGTLASVLEACQNQNGALIITLGAGDVKHLGKRIFNSLKNYSWQSI
jgi:UDP-N-acetylmuramate--alanine ligase